MCYRLVLAILLILLAAGAALGLAFGHGSLREDETRWIFLSLRACCLGATSLAGAGLALGGVVVQGLFRNPLASPDVLGTTTMLL